jgi:thiaminase/transcriptional activator TenA
LGDWLRDHANSLAQSQSQQHIQKMEEAYMTSLRYEYLFWESCYDLEVWPA